MTWRQLQGDVVDRLAAAGLPHPEADARRIIEQAAGCTPTELTLIGQDEPTALAAAHVERMVTRRCAGEPLQYVLGSWGFRALDLFVDARVLIPRPETEVVAGRAIAELDRLRHDGLDGAVVADLGTGSGAIGLSIAAERERVEVWLTDRSADALAVARANLAGLGRAATRVRLAEGDWFDALPDALRGRLAVVVSNPPYVADDDDLPAAVRDWEPHDALFAGPDGLDDLLQLVDEAITWLMPGGALVLEVDPRQVAAVRDTAVRHGYASTEVEQDLTGRDRVLVARR